MSKFVKKGSDYSREVLKFVKKGSGYSREVLKFVKKIKSVGFINIC